MVTTDMFGSVCWCCEEAGRKLELECSAMSSSVTTQC